MFSLVSTFYHWQQKNQSTKKKNNQGWPSECSLQLGIPKMENAFPNAMAVFLWSKWCPSLGRLGGYRCQLLQCHRWLPSEKGFDGDHRPIIVLSRKKIRNGNLVGGFNPSEKYESQLGWWHSQYTEKTCSEPPTSNYTMWGPQDS